MGNIIALGKTAGRMEIQLRQRKLSPRCSGGFPGEEAHSSLGADDYGRSRIKVEFMPSALNDIEESGVLLISIRGSEGSNGS